MQMPELHSVTYICSENHVRCYDESQSIQFPLHLQERCHGAKRPEFINIIVSIRAHCLLSEALAEPPATIEPLSLSKGD